MVSRLAGVQDKLAEMSGNLKSLIHSMPVEWFTAEPPDVNILCPFPKFAITAGAMPTMLRLEDIQTLLAGPCAEMQKMLQSVCINPNLAGPMGELLKSLS